MPASRGIIQLVEKHVDVSTRENQSPQRGLLLDSSFSSPAGQQPLSIAVTQQPTAQSSFRDSLSLFLSLSRLLVNSRPGQKEKARRKETRVVSPDARPPATFQNAIRPGTTVTFSRSTNEGARVVWVNERPKGWRRWRGVRGLFSLLTFLSFSLSLSLSLQLPLVRIHLHPDTFHRHSSMLSSCVPDAGVNASARAPCLASSERILDFDPCVYTTWYSCVIQSLKYRNIYIYIFLKFHEHQLSWLYVLYVIWNIFERISQYFGISFFTVNDFKKKLILRKYYVILLYYIMSYVVIMFRQKHDCISIFILIIHILYIYI